MARKPDEYLVRILLRGHQEEVRFLSIQEFHTWFNKEIVQKSDSKDFINVPIKNIQGEYMMLRPADVIGFRVEPIFFGSVDRDAV